MKDERQRMSGTRHGRGGGVVFRPSSFIFRRSPHVDHRARRRSRRARGARPFIRHEGTAVSYGEFERLTNQAAQAFAELGVTQGRPGHARHGQLGRVPRGRFRRAQGGRDPAPDQSGARRERAELHPRPRRSARDPHRRRRHRGADLAEADAAGAARGWRRSARPPTIDFAALLARGVRPAARRRPHHRRRIDPALHVGHDRHRRRASSSAMAAPAARHSTSSTCSASAPTTRCWR